MVIHVKPTSEVYILDGVECRRWEGVDEEGLPCDLFVHRVRSASPLMQEKLQRTIVELAPPRDVRRN